MPDSPYLSIGEVLGLLLEDFPDVTISKIRFLESQGLIEPERTPSGYRKFYDHDVELLRTILHEQRENFLPLKVIRDRLESGAIDAETGPTRTPPRGIRNVESRESETRDSVFRRTDGGPEWVEGHALIPGEYPFPAQPSSPITAAVPVTPAAPVTPALPVTPKAESVRPTAEPATPAESEPGRDTPKKPTKPAEDTPAVTNKVVGAIIEAPAEAAKPAPAAAVPEAKSPAREVTARIAGSDTRGLVYDRLELCATAGISLEQLAQLEEFGIVVGRGSGNDATYNADAIEIARIAARFMEQGIDARHLRGWRQAAERESALFEQRIMPLLRQRNPQSRQLALDTLTDLAELGSQFRQALIGSMLRHHFDGG